MRSGATTLAVLATLVSVAAGCSAASDASVAGGASGSVAAGGNAAAAGPAMNVDAAGSAGVAGSAEASDRSVAEANAGAAGSAGFAGNTASACYSPVQPELRPTLQGCECETYQAEETGPQLGRVYCLSGKAVYCPKELGRWIIGFDGPCFPTEGSIPLDVCTEKLGGGPVASDSTCPTGFAAQHGFRNTANTPVTCCYPIRVTGENCMQADLEVQDGRVTDDVLGITCSNGNVVRAFVGESGTTVCCERD